MFCDSDRLCVSNFVDIFIQNQKKGYTELEIDVLDIDNRDPVFTSPEYQLNVTEEVNFKLVSYDFTRYKMFPCCKSE